MSLEWWAALGGVILLGLQTSISPCPLTTNIAAISYISRKVSRTRDVLLSGALYTLGRTLAYVLLAVLVLSAMLFSGEAMMRFLATQIHGYLGPLLILVGMMLLGMISFNFGGVQGDKMQKMADTLGIGAALPLGAIFALAFCPTSAATHPLPPMEPMENPAVQWPLRCPMHHVARSMMIHQFLWKSNHRRTYNAPSFSKTISCNGWNPRIGRRARTSQCCGPSCSLHGP